MSHEPPATAASPERFLAGDGFGAIEIVADAVPLLQRFFDANPDYFLAVNGEIAGVGEAHEEVHGSLPAGWPFTRKWVVGLVDSNGELVAMLNVVSDLLAAGIWHVGLFMVEKLPAAPAWRRPCCGASNAGRSQAAPPGCASGWWRATPGPRNSGNRPASSKCAGAKAWPWAARSTRCG